MAGAVNVSIADLTDRVARAFVASRTAPDVAALVARALVQAEVDGQKGHGLSRVESYTAQSRSGKVDGFAKPVVTSERAGALRIDAAHGFAYPAFDMAIAELPKAAAGCGIAGAAITRSHHCGAMGRHVERLAEAGLVALAFANTPDAMAPWHGRKRLYGTNPIAFAAPQRTGAPLVIDLALSQVARGKILNAAQRGEPIPPDWATDADGQPTTDAQAALGGTLMPIGGAKGAALALMVEILAATLTGANYAYEASSFFDDKGPPPGVGQFLLAIDTDAFAGREAFLDRLGELAGLIVGEAGARLPGSRRLALREAAERDGVAISLELLGQIDAIARGGG